jgi:hypothetical protein
VGESELRTMDETEDYTMNFEAVKSSFRQTKDGYHLTLVIHPNDAQSLPDLVSSWVGTRYQCCLVQVNDENIAVPKKKSVEANASVQQAAMLCRSIRFQAWLHNTMECNPEERDVWGESEEEHTARLLRKALDIESRSELKYNEEAQDKLKRLYESFKKEVGR